jgi:curli biogenesis system outer membrane secretion channel CsgG
MKGLALALSLAALAAPALNAQDAPAPASAPAAKRRVAVLDFDYATVHSYVAGLMGSDVDVGKSVAALLLPALSQNGTYTVVERAQLDRVLNEQNFQQDARSDVSSAAKLGRLLGVDAIIIGSITTFQREDKNIQLGLRKETKATVAIDARIVQIGTGEILAVAHGRGEAKRARMKTEEDNHPLYRQGQDPWSADLASTLIGEAIRAAVDSLVATLVAAAPKIPHTETVAVIAGLVADVSGSELIINVGTASGVKVGAEYAVMRPGRDIKDPATGAVLRHLTTPVGKIKITSADAGSATGTLTGDPAHASDPAHIGDCVGACPLAPAGGTPEQREAQRPAPAASPLPRENVGAQPVVYAAPVSAPFTWSGYTFRGTEHFRYEALMNVGGHSQSGFYELDASDAGGGRTQLRVQGQMGRHPFSSTIILGPNESLSATQIAQLGPAASVLFSPGYAALFAGHPWVLGEGWSSSGGGLSSGFKVESTCQYAGVQGLRGVMRQNDQVVMDLCVSPNVGLPLEATTGYGSGPSSYSYAITLTQFRP